MSVDAFLHLRSAHGYKWKDGTGNRRLRRHWKSNCRALAASGADVAVSYVGEAGALASSLKIRKAGGAATPYSWTNEIRNRLMVRWKCNRPFWTDRHSRQQAGWNIGIPFGELDALTPEIWDRVLETNLRGPFLLSRAFASELRRHKAGRVINIASLAGIAPGGSSIAYAASKAAMIHLTHCLAVALAPDVTVNCVASGLVEGTRMAERVPEAMKQMARARSVLGRTGSADDIAQMVIGYCRMESVTGQTVVVDGGNPWGCVERSNTCLRNIRSGAGRYCCKSPNSNKPKTLAKADFGLLCPSVAFQRRYGGA